MNLYVTSQTERKKRFPALQQGEKLQLSKNSVGDIGGTLCGWDLYTYDLLDFNQSIASLQLTVITFLVQTCH